MWPINSEFRIKNLSTFGGPEKGRLGFYWSLSNTVVLLEAARLSNNSRFSLLLGFRLQTQTKSIMKIAKIIVPAMARRIISFFDSTIGIKALVVSSVVLVISSVVKTVSKLEVSLVVSSVVVSSVEVRVNNSVLVRIFIFLFLIEMRSMPSLYLTGNDAKEATYAWVGPPCTSSSI